MVGRSNLRGSSSHECQNSECDTFFTTTCNIFKIRKILGIQSNLCQRPPPNSDHLSKTTTILGFQFRLLLHKWPLNNGHPWDPKKRRLLTGGRCSEVIEKRSHRDLKIVAAIDRWSLFEGFSIISLKHQFNFFSERIPRPGTGLRPSVEKHRSRVYHGVRQEACWLIWRFDFRLESNFETA